MSKVLTLTIELSDSEYQELVQIADHKDLSLETMLVEIINDKFGITGV